MRRGHAAGASGEDFGRGLEWAAPSLSPSLTAPSEPTAAPSVHSPRPLCGRLRRYVVEAVSPM
eukprot:scaffold101829_cov36-Phaeocystis_antarctica.AAC.1